MRQIPVVLLVALLQGCALLKGERRPPPPPVSSPVLEPFKDEAIGALLSFHRQFGVVERETQVSAVYFTQGDWEMRSGPFSSMRQAGVVFITRDNDGCAWSSWTMAQKSLGADGWGLPTLLPGPEDTDQVTCQVLEPRSRSAAAGPGGAPPSARSSEPPPQPPGGLGPPKEASVVAITCTGSSIVAALQNKVTVASGQALSLQKWSGSAWVPYARAHVSSVAGPKVTLELEAGAACVPVPARFKF